MFSQIHLVQNTEKSRKRKKMRSSLLLLLLTVTSLYRRVLIGCSEPTVVGPVQVQRSLCVMRHCFVGSYVVVNSDRFLGIP